MIGKVFIAAIAGVIVYFVASVIPYVKVFDFWFGGGTVFAVGVYLLAK